MEISGVSKHWYNNYTVDIHICRVSSIINYCTNLNLRIVFTLAAQAASCMSCLPPIEAWLYIPHYYSFLLQEETIIKAIQL